MTTSAINYSTINISFPAAGQDNDSQGFRDNFALIKSALGTAQSEITYLNTYAVDVTKNNDIGGNTFSNVVLRGSGLASTTAVASSGTSNAITYAESHYRRYALGNSSNTFQVDYWPLSSYGELWLELSTTTTSKQVFFQKGVINTALGTVDQKVYLGVNDFTVNGTQYGFGTNQYITVNPAYTTLVKMSSPDGGVTTYVSVVDVFKLQVV